MTKKIVPRKSELKAEASSLVKRGFKSLKYPTIKMDSSNVVSFLDSVGGIPADNSDMRFRNINSKLIEYFSRIEILEIANILEEEYNKRPNGRTLKLIGFAYFNTGQIDKAINVLKKSLSITEEDPVAIYEELGRAYILEGELEKAGQWFGKSYRYDFHYYLEVFGWEFLFVTAIGRKRMRPPIFGAFADDFSKEALQIELYADAISIAYGYKKGHKSLAHDSQEQIMIDIIGHTCYSKILPGRKW